MIPEKKDDPDIETKIYEIEVITPMFGGGAEAGIADPAMPIRASSVRGHLRFWWRATRGANYNNEQDLRQREGEIWGTTDNPSPVIIEVVQPKEIQYRSPPDYGFFRYGPEVYALFSAKAGEAELIKENFNFTVIISWLKEKRLNELRKIENEKLIQQKKEHKPERIDPIENDIEAAFWAWVNFGGIGARTRRGCGALYCKEFAPPDDDIGKWYSDSLKKYQIDKNTPKSWPTLPEKLRINTNNQIDPLKCWSDVVGGMKDFRQGKVGRNVYSKSFWPEPETIRETIQNQNGLKIRPKGRKKTDNRITVKSFPRAEFGMPIIFELKDEYIGNNTDDDNIKPTLQPNEKNDRMASPLILKPIKYQNGCKSLILRLKTNPLDSAYLKPGKHDLTTGVSLSYNDIVNTANAAYPNSPMRFSRGGKHPGSALEAFLAYAEENGFQEVPK